MALPAVLPRTTRITRDQTRGLALLIQEENTWYGNYLTPFKTTYFVYAPVAFDRHK